MARKEYFRKGDPIIGFTFAGQKIIGIYLRPAASFGVIVRGCPAEAIGEVQEYKVARLTLTRQPNTRKTGGKGKLGIHRYQFGDWVTGVTKDFQCVIGRYMNAAEIPYAYIKGVKLINGKTSPFESFEAYKVHRNSLKIADPQ